MASFIITASSQPVYDAWGFGDYWGCAEWIKWYNELRTVYSAEQTDYLWSKAWLAGVSSVAGGNGTAPGANYVSDSVPLDCRTFDTNFRAFLDQHKNLNAAVYSGLAGLIAKPLGLSVDVVNGVINFGTGAISTAETTGKILKYAIPIAIVVFIVFLLVVAIKYSNKKLKAI